MGYIGDWLGEEAREGEVGFEHPHAVVVDGVAREAWLQQSEIPYELVVHDGASGYAC